MKANKKITSKLVIVGILLLIIAAVFFVYNRKEIVCNYDNFTSNYKYAKDYKEKEDIVFTYKSIFPHKEETLKYVKEGTMQNKKGEYEINYTATYNNLTKTITEKVIIDEEFIDITPPVLTLKGNSIETIYVGDDYVDVGFSASDDEDGDLSDKVIVKSNIDTNKRGVYEVNYEVSDSNGNKFPLENTGIPIVLLIVSLLCVVISFKSKL